MKAQVRLVYTAGCVAEKDREDVGWDAGKLDWVWRPARWRC